MSRRSRISLKHSRARGFDRDDFDVEPIGVRKASAEFYALRACLLEEATELVFERRWLKGDDIRFEEMAKGLDRLEMPNASDIEIKAGTGGNAARAEGFLDGVILM